MKSCTSREVLNRLESAQVAKEDQNAVKLFQKPRCRPASTSNPRDDHSGNVVDDVPDITPARSLILPVTALTGLITLLHNKGGTRGLIRGWWVNVIRAVVFYGLYSLCSLVPIHDQIAVLLADLLTVHLAAALIQYTLYKRSNEPPVAWIPPFKKTLKATWRFHVLNSGTTGVLQFLLGQTTALLGLKEQMNKDSWSFGDVQREVQLTRAGAKLQVLLPADPPTL